MLRFILQIDFLKVLDWFQEPVRRLTETEFFQQYALLVMAMVGSLPSFVPIPNELVMIPGIALGINPIAVMFAVGIGGTAGDMLVYLGAKHIRRLVSGKKQKDVMSHFYKHKHIWYVISPSVFGWNDILLVISGIKHIPLMSILPYNFLGNMLRAIWGVILSVMGITVFNWFF